MTKQEAVAELIEAGIALRDAPDAAGLARFRVAVDAVRRTGEPQLERIPYDPFADPRRGATAHVDALKPVVRVLQRANLEALRAEVKEDSENQAGEIIAVLAPIVIGVAKALA